MTVGATLYFPNRKFIVLYYTSKNDTLLLSAPPSWNDYQELVNIAFFQVREFSIDQQLPELTIRGPSLPSSPSRYEVSWRTGSGFVVADSMDTETVRRHSLFRDKWAIQENAPEDPPGGSWGLY
ncbi:hypothetical protein [Marinitenerispora sediminis]|uniref:Uncharacterized protein n=1 Tax=Marinitenerispora sediminis TaxID=1931232 RepID=A0A368T8E1_9ACTN|nr:hypothetical protein [Marinitenerispora sediminis]RCV54315.1 hypothetical protein DEF28_08520 [Marinitenerispora sediminis]RCV60511.1 hypothetical protein DEF24_06945 [Marinitenerispora sediminis]RCV61063.1 hypothetical protein DEF23_03375 [Marinitenerispora sediminis]